MNNWNSCLRQFLLLVFLAFTGCVARQAIPGKKVFPTIGALKFLDVYQIPFKTTFKNTWVGGLSGIDYDPEYNRYFIISDERSATSAARFYTAAIAIKNYKIDTLRFLSVTTLRDPKGDTFPSLKIWPEHAADPESIRYNPVTRKLVR